MRLKPIETSCDVLVVGGGSAGVAAAVSASRNGAAVVLMEKNGFLGGMATAAMVGTVCGLYYRSEAPSGRFLNAGFGREFATTLAQASQSTSMQWRDGLHFLPYEPFAFRSVCDQFISQAHVKPSFHSVCHSLSLSPGKIEKVSALCWNKTLEISPLAIVDCTGEASISALADGDLVADQEIQAASFVFSLTGVKPIDEKALVLVLMRELKRGVDEGVLTEEASWISLIPGSLRDQSVYLKLTIPHAIGQSADEITHLELLARKSLTQILPFLKSRIAAFAEANLANVASQVGMRTGRRPVGKYVLSHADVLAARKHSDGVARGSWPIEWWNLGKKPELEFFAPDDFYEIPAGALMSNKYENLFFAGRSFSADSRAIASARVIGTCLATGFAAGKLAAFQAQGKSLETAVAQLREEITV